MRVLLVTNVLQRRSMAVWREVTQRGIDLHVLGSPSSFGNPLYPPDEPEEPSWAPATLDVPWGWRRRGHLWWRYPALPRLVRSFEPDLVHVISEPWGLLVTQSLRHVERVVAHGSASIYGTGGAIEQAIRRVRLRHTLPQLAGFAGATRRSVELAREHGLPSSTPTTVAQHLVPDPTALVASATSRDRQRAARFGTDDTPIIGFVGRLEPEKGPGWLLAAFASMRNPARLVIVGEGSQRASLEEAARRTAKSVQFTGRIPRADIPDLLVAFDVLVVPSRSTPDWVEHFGRVPLEGMLAGTPVVVSTSGHLPELVGDAGRVVEDGNRTQLAAVLDELAAEPAARRALGAAGQRRALEDHAPAAVADRIIALWDRCLRRPT